MTNKVYCSNRKVELDIMKGISILLMIFAHSEKVGYAHNVIYSFHMPLFFVLGGYLCNDNCNIRNLYSYTIKGVKRLLCPYIITMILICIWIWRFEVIKLRFDLSIYPIVNLLWGSGDILESSFGTLYVGPLWFLFNIFITREIFYILCATFELFKNILKLKSLILCISFIISIIAIICYPKIEPMPWNFIPGLGALMFYAIGWFCKRYTVEWWMKKISVICWVVAIFVGGIDMRSCSYKLLPLDFIGAMGGIYVVYMISYKLVEFSQYSLINNYVVKFLKWCGNGSLCILCMHSFDIMGGVSTYIVNLFNKINFSFDSYIILFCNFLIPLLLTYIITKIPLLYRIYY